MGRGRASASTWAGPWAAWPVSVAWCRAATCTDPGACGMKLCVVTSGALAGGAEWHGLAEHRVWP